MKRIVLLMFTGILAVQLSAQPLTKIADIQKINDQDLIQGNDLSYMNGDTVTIQGIVTFNPCYYALSTSGSRIGTWLQDTAGGAWSGIHILMEPGLVGYSGTMSDMNNDIKYLDNFVIGNEVRCTGIVSDYSNNSQILLLPVQSTIQNLGNMPAPKIVTVDSFMQSDGAGGQTLQKLTGEKWEGVYVELQNVTVVDIQQSGSRWYWSIQDSKGDILRIRDVSGSFRDDAGDDHCNGFGSGISATPTPFTPPTLGSFLSWIRGIIIEYNGYYYLAPRDLTDVGPVAAAPPVIADVTRTPVVATSSQSVAIHARIWDPDGVVNVAKLYYSIGLGNPVFTEVSMVNTSGDDWSATIPSSNTDSTIVNFYMMAVDDDFDTTTSEQSHYITFDHGINDISQLQYSLGAGGASIWSGDTIPQMNVNCVITSTLNTYDLGLVVVQDGAAPWSGIILQKTTGDGLEDLFRGDSIMITSGVVTESFGVTMLSNVSFTSLGAGVIPAMITTLDPDSLLSGVNAEPYEGMLIRFNDAYVFSSNPDGVAEYGEWSGQNDTRASDGLRCDDYSFDINYGFNTDSLSVGMLLPFIQGVFYYSFGNWKMLPRNRADIGGFSTPYPKDITAFAFLGLNPQVFCAIDQNTLTIGCDVPNGTDVSNLEPTVDYTGQYLSPANQSQTDFTNPVDYMVTAPVDGSTKHYTVTVTIGVGIDQPELSDLKVYPNPANGKTMVFVSLSRAAQVKARLRSLNGRLVGIQSLDLPAGVSSFDLSLEDITPGIYLLQLQGDGFTAVRKVMVVR